jgi:predicted glutamine amidotransferase
MCAIIAWNGQLPDGLLRQLLHKSLHRGADSTGIAYRGTDFTVCTKQAVASTLFTKLNGEEMKKASASRAGIGHVRRASPGMPVNEDNAHPFKYKRMFYAHNGKIDNWRDVRDQLASVARVGNDLKLADKIDAYRTDSMVIGPSIERRDLSNLEGCMALAWMSGADVYAACVKKEMSIYRVRWSTLADDEPRTFTVVVSVPKILTEALAAVKNLIVEHKLCYSVNEGTVYKLETDEVYIDGVVPVSTKAHADKFSSGLVPTPKLVQGTLGEAIDEEDETKLSLLIDDLSITEEERRLELQYQAESGAI